MKNLWNDADAAQTVRRYADEGVAPDLALRVYTSRLYGKERRLVIHGGGNTSVKTTQRDFLGDECEVLCVKGSGWDLDTIEPAGLPAVHLPPLRKVRARNALSDEEMLAFLRSNLLDASSPNPSVETLLHAFLPQKFVDHTHSSAILALTDQPDGDRLCQGVFGARLAIQPYVMPGFLLAKAVADAFERDTRVDGVLLGKHGLFTFGDTAKQAYDRMIDLVSLAENEIDRAPGFSPAPRGDLSRVAALESVAPIVRGAGSTALGGGRYRRAVAAFRTSAAIRTFVDGADLADYGARGVITPDHIIRTKNKYLVLPPPAADELEKFRAAAFAAASDYRARYDA